MCREHASNNISGFILDKSIAVNSPKRMENVKILIANTCERYMSYYFLC